MYIKIYNPSQGFLAGKISNGLRISIWPRPGDLRPDVESTDGEPLPGGDNECGRLQNSLPHSFYVGFERNRRSGNRGAGDYPVFRSDIYASQIVSPGFDCVIRSFRPYLLLFSSSGGRKVTS